ncbi:MAG: rpfC, partial [Verrucomicrobiales bacterium]|nr:rpfC [Verrucomicrobiales bacterium]
MDLGRTIFSWLTGFARIGSFLSASVAGLVLLGWLLDIEVLKRILPGFVAMNPAAAVAFVLAGIALWGRSSQFNDAIGPSSRDRLLWKIAPACALIIGSIGTLKLVGLLLGWEAGIDQILFHDKLAGSGADLPNRMAPNTAVNFVLLGVSLWFVGRTSRVMGALPHLLAILVGLVSWLAIIGYVYGAASLYGIRSFIPMALHTATLFLILSLGILSLQPDRGLMGILTHAGAGGQIARRMLPAMILIPSAFGWLWLLGGKQGW